MKRTIAELKEQYDRKFELTDEEKNLVPKLPEKYNVSSEAQEIMDAVINSPMRVSLVSGKLAQAKQQTQKL